MESEPGRFNVISRIFLLKNIMRYESNQLIKNYIYYSIINYFTYFVDNFILPFMFDWCISHVLLLILYYILVILSPHIF